MKIEFTDGWIEETGSGLTCVGKSAVEAGIIIRKTGASLELFKKAFDSQVEKIKNNLTNK